MADELAISIAMSFAKSGRLADLDGFSALAQLIDVSGTNYTHKTQSVGTTSEALNLGEVVTPGWIGIKNCDAANFVLYDRTTISSTTATIKILPGEVQAFRNQSTAPHVKADTSTCIIEYLLIEA